MRRAYCAFSICAVAAFLPAQAALTAEPQNGLYAQRGYSRIYQIEGGQPKAMWNAGRTFCYPNTQTISSFDRKKMVDELTFSSFENGGITNYFFDRVEALPSICSETQQRMSDNPASNLDHLWRQFDEVYGLFDLKQVNWLKSYREHVASKADADRENAWDSATKMLADLNDGHVGLDDPASGKSWSVPRNRSLQIAINALSASEAKTLGVRDTASIRGNEASVMNAAKSATYRKYVRTLKSNFDGRLVWGDIGSDIGYIGIHSMKFPSTQYPNLREELNALDHLLKHQMTQFTTRKRALIVDVRFNQGGMDAIAMRLASAFAGKQCLAFRKRSLGLGETSAAQDVFVENISGQSRDLPVVVLTSPQTASAAEIFILAMRALPNVTMIGEKTWGVFSDEWDGLLPNGWEFTMSNERYISADGQDFEGRGVPADIEIPVFKAPAVLENIHASMDRALAELKSATLPRRSDCLK
jgi:carboxyl-terminal processing protease